jgi:conjugative relaxase-like TrwC/TraI family protein
VQIEQVQQRAAQTFAILLGEEAAYSRQGSAGRHRAPCSVVAALFPHFISRSGDPQLHTHCVMLNVAVRFDGTTGGLETLGMMRLLGVAATRYHEVLADGMQQLGFQVRQRGKLFEIDGVPVEVCEEFSRRRAAALAQVGATGTVQKQSEERSSTNRKRMQVAILRTRPKRRVYSLDQVRRRWQERAHSLNFEYSKMPRRAGLLPFSHTP